ncbi:Activator of 90 kDa heat shock protein ATPase-2 [Galemys pyrenaicus]|uniref:Activator of 90 kDa heat shock protein ATPase-2 n=1 Tax=Galemys pyrenaicus TaxID=202257 RepID=A0A8J6DI52_GALPY|nr:Activator of 90 kDa heat shock protein ATPase-2 [Galemys pyrenaicus]
MGLVVENEAGGCEISELKQAEGTIKESDVRHKGLTEIPNLSEENEVDDTEVNVSKKKGDGGILKDLMKTAGIAKVREALGDYLKALKTVKPHLQGTGCKDSHCCLHMTELFDTAAEQLHSIFTVKDLVQKYSKSPAVLEAEKGGNFQMFDGSITGEYIELKLFSMEFPLFSVNKKIVMKWRSRNWPEEHYARVALNFVPTTGQTELQLDCKGVPVCKEENMKFCWQKQHFEEMKGLLQLTTLND